jgi:hypothetical protein
VEILAFKVIGWLLSNRKSCGSIATVVVVASMLLLLLRQCCCSSCCCCCWVDVVVVVVVWLIVVVITSSLLLLLWFFWFLVVVVVMPNIELLTCFEYVYRQKIPYSIRGFLAIPYSKLQQNEQGRGKNAPQGGHLRTLLPESAQ